MGESADMIAKNLLVGNENVCGKCAYLSSDAETKKWSCWGNSNSENNDVYLDTPACSRYMNHITGNGKAYEEAYRLSHVKELKLEEKHDKWIKEVELEWKGKKFSLLDRIKYKIAGI